MLNIFKSIREVTHRIEPFHSQFLADALNASIQGDRSLFDAVWRLAAPDGWEPPDCPKVDPEHDTGAGRRIDICIVDNSGIKERVLGIEVKTSSDSGLPGQLEAYQQGLAERYQGANIAIAYLTPFNRQRAGSLADGLPTTRVFEEFARSAENARHLSWLDISEIEWDGGDIWRQHQSYVRDKIASEEQLKSAALRNQSFDEFFGAEAAGRFWEALVEIGIHPDETGAEIDLTQLDADANSLSRAFEILIKDGEGVADPEKTDRFTDDQRQPFITSEYREFHAALFGLSRRFPNVWVQGEKDYAIRIAHNEYGSGVSLVRSRGKAILETGRPRRAREV